MPDEITHNIEQKVVTVPALGDTKATANEVDSIMDAMPAFLEKRGVNVQTGERTTPPEQERKEHTPATDSQKQELEDMLGEEKQTKKPDKGEDKKTDEGKEELVVKRGEGGKFVKVEKKQDKQEDKKADDKHEDKKPFADLSDEGINKEVENLRTGKQETKERYASLLRELKSAREAGELTKKEFEQAKAEVAEAKKAAEEAVKKAVEPEEVVKRRQEEAEELAMLRRQYILENDPNIKKQYDDQISGAEDAIQKTLAEAGVPAASVELIKKSGGWSAFAKSRLPMAWTEYDDEGKTVTKRGTQAEYAAKIMTILDPSDAASITARMGKQVLLKDQREQFIQEEKKKAGEFFKSMEQKARAQNEEAVSKIKKLVDDYSKWADEITGSTDFLKDEQVPENATKEQKAEIEEANKDRATIRDYIKAQKQTTSLETYQDLVLRAARGMASERLSKASEARIAALEKAIQEKDAELEKVRSAGRSVQRSNSLGAGSGTAETPKKNIKDVTETDILDDLENLRASKA